jgi:hypothetical protein
MHSSIYNLAFFRRTKYGTLPFLKLFAGSVSFDRFILSEKKRVGYQTRQGYLKWEQTNKYKFLKNGKGGCQIFSGS